MLNFESDYLEGCHPKLLDKLIKTNLEPLSGYGSDKYCDSAKKKIAKACECPNAQVALLVGGTQTNQVVISSVLRSFEGVISAETGHVNGHEAGAIEYSGHKVLALPSADSKVHADAVREYFRQV